MRFIKSAISMFLAIVILLSSVMFALDNKVAKASAINTSLGQASAGTIVWFDGYRWIVVGGNELVMAGVIGGGDNYGPAPYGWVAEQYLNTTFYNSLADRAWIQPISNPYYGGGTIYARRVTPNEFNGWKGYMTPYLPRDSLAWGGGSAYSYYVIDNGSLCVPASCGSSSYQWTVTIVLQGGLYLDSNNSITTSAGDLVDYSLAAKNAAEAANTAAQNAAANASNAYWMAVSARDAANNAANVAQNAVNSANNAAWWAQNATNSANNATWWAQTATNNTNYIINTQLPNLQNTVNNVSGQVSTVQNGVNTVQNTVNTINSTVNSVSSQVNGVQSSINQLTYLKSLKSLNKFTAASDNKIRIAVDAQPGVALQCTVTGVPPSSITWPQADEVDIDITGLSASQIPSYVTVSAMNGPTPIVSKKIYQSDYYYQTVNLQ